MSLAERIKLSFKMPPCLVEGNVPLFFLEGITSPSKPNVALLYWSLPPSVLCQWLRQIMVLRDHSLISLLFSLVKEYGSRMNLEILILHFENKNYFDVSLKQFDFEILQLLGYFLFLEKRLFALVFGNEIFGGNTSWDDILFQSEGLEKKLEVLFEKNNWSPF